MGIKSTLIALRTEFFIKTEEFIKYLAGYYGYPENPGMPIVENSTVSEMAFHRTLPIHNPRGWPPFGKPETLWQMFVGTRPQIDPIERIIYESQHDGFYNFYIQNYKNLYFLPDWLSEFIQIRLNICLDITPLEVTREVLFLLLYIYVQMLNIRLALFWYLTINPYTRPWIYFIAMTDWVEDALAGFTPVIFGVDVMPTLVIALTGKIADSLNHLVFTMPFLPSEGQRAKMMIDGGLRDILVFRYLPVLWYKHSIPDEIREFWYTERRDIFNYMKKQYKNLDIELLPNRILKETYEHQHSLSENINTIKDLSTQMLCNNNLLQTHEFGNSILHSHDQFYNSLISHIDKLIF